MCGIAGFLARDTLLDTSLIEKMTTAIAHRGPDDQGFASASDGPHFWKQTGEFNSVAKVAFGFRRLSILDLSPKGAQPMVSPDGRYWLIFNGQIYNYVELRKELGNSNFQSTSDTEVLLHLLMRFGVDCLSRLNGMFAFALWDTQEKRLLLVRDPIGIKPLYYTLNERGLFFSSEIRALLAASEQKPQLRTELMSRFVMSGWITEPDTLFKNIYRLDPGHFLSVSEKLEVKKVCYWEMNFQEESHSESEWVDNLNSVLQQTIDRQLRSDVPVGFFLSGGVDSSLLVAKARELRKDPPSTFTIGFRWSNSAKDELDVLSARRLKKEFPLDYHEMILEPSIVSLLPKVIRSLEEPMMDPAAICSFLICEAAHSSFKVLMSGQGGDEVFGGYPIYQGGRIAAGLQSLPKFLFSWVNSSQKLPYAFGRRPVQWIHQLKKLALVASRPWPEPFFLLRSAMPGVSLGDVLLPSVLRTQDPPFERHLEHFKKAGTWDLFHQMMFLDMKTYLTATNLAYSDKTSMANSVELRVPYLDLEMIRLAQRLPSRFKVRLTQKKILLKDLAKAYLPDAIVHRKKTGFGLPLRDWFRKDLQPMAADLLNEDRLSQQKIFQPQFASKWLKEHREMKADHSMRLYTMMSFQLWLEAFDVQVS